MEPPARANYPTKEGRTNVNTGGQMLLMIFAGTLDQLNAGWHRFRGFASTDVEAISMAKDCLAKSLPVTGWAQIVELENGNIYCCDLRSEWRPGNVYHLIELGGPTKASIDHGPIGADVLR
jgi:hypothetical protein